MIKYYTGIGSRETPLDVLELMVKISQYLSTEGYILRSGGAFGADIAFENGAGDKKQIYLPWRKFNGNMSPLFSISKEAMTMGAKFHPAWWSLSEGAQKLHARNCYQVLGENLNKPSDFIICWTPKYNDGGTGQAIRVAKANNIKIYNLNAEDNRKYWEEKIEQHD